VAKFGDDQPNQKVTKAFYKLAICQCLTLLLADFEYFMSYYSRFCAFCIWCGYN